MKLKLIKKQTGGRNNQGVITAFHRGGGNKKYYRIIDFKRSLFRVPGLVKKIEKDPNRSSLIALIAYQNGLLSYILAPKKLKLGDKINQYSGHSYIKNPESELNHSMVQIGNAMPLKLTPLGSLIHNIELKPGKGGQLMRAAGTWAKLLTKLKQSIIRLHSGKLYSLSNEAMATLGTVSGLSNYSKSQDCSHAPTTKIKLTKAGQNRWRGRRPVVRGVAMNPIDHPHGGGEGKSKGGGHPVTPWGKLTKGKPTTRSKLKVRS